MVACLLLLSVSSYISFVIKVVQNPKNIVKFIKTQKYFVYLVFISFPLPSPFIGFAEYPTLAIDEFACLDLVADCSKI
jgi:hypothetical protein